MGLSSRLINESGVSRMGYHPVSLDYEQECPDREVA